jgi:hypothetical protein
MATLVRVDSPLPETPARTPCSVPAAAQGVDQLQATRFCCRRYVRGTRHGVGKRARAMDSVRGER